MQSNAGSKTEADEQERMHRWTRVKGHFEFLGTEGTRGKSGETLETAVRLSRSSFRQISTGRAPEGRLGQRTGHERSCLLETKPKANPPNRNPLDPPHRPRDDIAFWASKGHGTFLEKQLRWRSASNVRPFGNRTGHAPDGRSAIELVIGTQAYSKRNKKLRRIEFSRSKGHGTPKKDIPG